MTSGTLVYVFKSEKVLLAMKKVRFGKGRWNGMGGKVHPEETPKQAAMREVKEEVGLDVTLNNPVGTLTFHNSSKGDWTVHVFATDQFSGVERETEEMQPQWFNIDNVPYNQMWDDDKLWYPHLFKRQPFRAEFWFGPEEKVIRHEITSL